MGGNIIKKYSLIAIVITILVAGIVNIYYLSNRTVILNFYSHSDQKGTVRESIIAFEALNPKIKVNLIELPDDTNEKFDLLSSQLALKDGSVDIIDSDVTWPANFVKANWVEPLSSYFSETEINAYFPSAIEAGKVDNVLYGIPYRFDSGLMFYRKDLLKKYGFAAPKTYTELKAISKSIIAHEPEIIGYAGSWKNFEGLTCNFLELYWALGGELHVNPSGDVHFDTAKATEALTFMVNAIQKDRISPKEATTFSSGDARKLFVSGKLLFLRDWPAGWAVLTHPDSTVKDAVGVIPLPHFNSVNEAPGTYGGWQYMISKYSKHKKQAADFIRFLTSDAEQKRTFLSYSYLPTKESLYFDEAIQSKIPFASELLDYFAIAKARPKVPQYDEITFVIQNEVHKALLGSQSVENAILEIETQLNALVK